MDITRSFTAWVAACRDALAALLLVAVTVWIWRTLSPGWFWIISLSALAGMAGLFGWEAPFAARRAWARARQHRRTAAIYLGMRLGMALLLAALAAGAAWLVPCFSPAGLRITYFNGIAFEHRVCRRTVRELCHDYGKRAPARGVHTGNYSARGEGLLRAPAAADYSFYSQSDDGLQLIIDGNIVIDAWRDQQWASSGTAGHMVLTAGAHSLQVKYYNRAGEGAWRIKWAGGPIPANTVLGAPYLRKHK